MQQRAGFHCIRAPRSKLAWNRLRSSWSLGLNPGPLVSRVCKAFTTTSLLLNILNFETVFHCFVCEVISFSAHFFNFKIFKNRWRWIGGWLTPSVHCLTYLPTRRVRYTYVDKAPSFACFLVLISPSNHAKYNILFFCKENIIYLDSWTWKISQLSLKRVDWTLPL